MFVLAVGAAWVVTALIAGLVTGMWALLAYRLLILLGIAVSKTAFRD
jgi:hypothetical protein